MPNPPMAPAAYFVDAVYKIPKYNEAGYIESLLDICYREHVNLLIPLYEPELPKLNERRQEFQQRNTFILLSNQDTIRICSDKVETYQFFKKIGVNTPYTWGINDLPRYPFHMKNQFSDKLWRILNEAGIRFIKKNIK